MTFTWYDESPEPLTPLMFDTIVLPRIQERLRLNQVDNDQRARVLLGQWVSELEPILFMRDFRVIGIGAHGCAEPTITIEQDQRPRHCFPAALDFRLSNGKTAHLELPE